MSVTSLQHFHLTVHVIKARPLQMQVHSVSLQLLLCDPSSKQVSTVCSPAFSVCSEGRLPLLSVPTYRDTFTASP